MHRISLVIFMFEDNLGFRLKTNGVHWHFKDSVQTKFGHPYIWPTFFTLNSLRLRTMQEISVKTNQFIIILVYPPSALNETFD
jgi:hypothetical protein